MTMAGGSDGTDISKVLKPTFRSHSLNQSSSLCLGCRNHSPFPANGNVPGGRLYEFSRGCLQDQGREFLDYGSLFPSRLILDRWPWRNQSAVRRINPSIMRYILQSQFNYAR